MRASDLDWLNVGLLKHSAYTCGQIGESYPESREVNMKKSSVIFVSVCLVGLTQSLWSQNSSSVFGRHNQSHGVAGYLDPTTGVFTSRAHALQSSEAQEPVTVTAVPFEIAVNGAWHLSTIPKSTDIVECEATATVGDTNGDYFESGASLATISGSTATCNVLLPVEWTLANPTTDMFSVGYTISIIRAFTVGSTTTAVAIRSVDVSVFGPQKVPASGAIVTLTVPSPRI
jgi:hypothetical protein